MTRPAGLLLAAGEGRRFGGPKALVSWHGELLVERGARVLREAGCAPVVVVLGASAAEVEREASLGAATVVVNDRWTEGIGSSLRAGLAALAATDAAAAVVALADQPSVTTQVVVRLVERWRAGAAAAVASYDGKPRNPVVLDASLWPEVSAAAHDDVGARDWLRAHPDRVVAVRCDDIGSDADIDTREDLDRLVEDNA